MKLISICGLKRELRQQYFHLRIMKKANEMNDSDPLIEVKTKVISS